MRYDTWLRWFTWYNILIFKHCTVHTYTFKVHIVANYLYDLTHLYLPRSGHLVLRLSLSISFLTVHFVHRSRLFVWYGSLTCLTNSTYWWCPNAISNLDSRHLSTTGWGQRQNNQTQQRQEISDVVYCTIASHISFCCTMHYHAIVYHMVY